MREVDRVLQAREPRVHRPSPGAGSTERGVDTASNGVASGSAGPSPRARGRLPELPVPDDRLRTIPAGAGSRIPTTRVVRGGPSPRERGSTWPGRSSALRGTGHPRGSEVDSRSNVAAYERPGPSPRARGSTISPSNPPRGWTDHPRGRGVDLAGPAGARSTCSRMRRTSRLGEHPRWRGATPQAVRADDARQEHHRGRGVDGRIVVVAMGHQCGIRRRYFLPPELFGGRKRRRVSWGATGRRRG